MQTLTLNRQALLALIVATAFPLSALAGVGNVEFTSGTVNAQSADGATRTLSKGAEVNIGDTLKTLSGRMQVKFSDGGYISLQPNTEFTIDEYNYTGNKDSKEKGFFKLVKGGLRAITGAIGKTDKESYKVSTPTATIGIRGTEYVALQEGDRLQVKVGAGAVVIQNDAGNLVLYQGQSGEVSGPSAPPQQSTETPTVTAAAPGGNTVTETTEDSGTDNIYVDGNVRLDDDTLCQTGSGDCTATVIDENLNQLVPSLALANQLIAGGLANIPLLNQISAAANYVSSQFAINFAGGTANGDAFLDVFFHNYTARTSISGLFSGGVYDGQFFFAGANGTLNSTTGALTFTNGTGQILAGGNNSTITNVSLTATGSLGATDLRTATVAYILSNGSTQGSGSTILMLDQDGAYIDGPFLQTLAQGGLTSIPTLGELGASGAYESTNTISLMGFSGQVNETLGVKFSDLSSNLSIVDAMTGGSNLSLNATGSLNSTTGQITLTPEPSIGPLTLVSASASLSTGDLRQSTINYVVDDGITQLPMTNSTQGTIVGLGQSD